MHLFETQPWMARVFFELFVCLSGETFNVGREAAVGGPEIGCGP